MFSLTSTSKKNIYTFWLKKKTLIWSYDFNLELTKKVREKSREIHNHKAQPIPDTKRKRKQTKPKKVREKSRECHNHKPQPIPDMKRKRKQTKPNKRISKKRTKSTTIISLFPKRGNRNAKRTEKYKNKITQGKN